MSYREGEQFIVGKSQEKPPPIQEGKIFHPEAGVKEILKAPTKERPQKLKEFKEKFAYQKEGLAKMQDNLIVAIRKNPDISPDELRQLAEPYVERYGLNEKQTKVTKALIERYAARHRKLREVRSRYADDRAFFEALFGRQPQGKIRVIEGPTMLYIKTYHPNDFALIDSHKYLTGAEVTLKDTALSLLVGGIALRKTRLPELDDAVVVENTTNPARFLGDPTSRKTFTHEEQHTIQFLFAHAFQKKIATVYNLTLTEDEEEQRRALQRYFRWQRQFVEEQRTKGELLAHLKTGESALMTVIEMRIPGALGSSYDYFADYIKKLPEGLAKDFGEEIHPLAQRVAKEVFGREYSQLLRKGARAYTDLRRHGYNHEQVVAILLPEEFRKWPKVAKRLLESKSTPVLR